MWKTIIFSVVFDMKKIKKAEKKRLEISCKQNEQSGSKYF